MQSQNFTKVDFPHDALRFMILQQFINTDDSLGMPVLFSARKLTKWYGFFVIFSNRHMACCFLHYLVILSICLSVQNMLFRINILRKFTVTQFFFKDRSEEKVRNSVLGIVSTGGILPFKVGILIFMYNFWCVNSIFVYNHHQVILNLHVLRVLKRTIEPSGGDVMLMRTWHDHVV